jgi:hypothetical protein
MYSQYHLLSCQDFDEDDRAAPGQQGSNGLAWASMFLSLVVPECDDAQLLARLIQGAQQLKEILPYPFELVCVGDSSRPHSTNQRGIRWVDVEREGHGNRVRAGMLAAQGLFRALIDPRWPVDPEQLQLLLPPVQSRFDICLGSRLAHGSSCLEESFASRIRRQSWSRISQGALKPRISDFLAPVQVYRADAARALFSRAVEDGRAVTIEVLAIADRMGLTIHEQAIDFEDNRERHPSIMSEGMDLLLALVRIRMRLETGAYPLLSMPVSPTIHRRMRA